MVFVLVLELKLNHKTNHFIHLIIAAATAMLFINCKLAAAVWYQLTDR